MRLTHLSLRYFRNYKKAEVAFSPGINWIQGNNGQGKTNLLEAIHLLSTGRSFRTGALSDLITWGETYFYVEGCFEKDGVQQELKVYYDATTRKVQYNQTVYPTLTSLLGILPSVLLSPDDITLVSGTPSERRRFIDMQIAQTDPLYLYHLGRYFKGMKQRNTLLKAKSDAAIFAWEQMMAQSASYLVIKREEATCALKTPSSRWMQTLSNDQDLLQIDYESSLPYSRKIENLTAHFMQIWQKNRAREMFIGSTAIGPHRDDIAISLGEKKAKVFSSEGQKRSCISSLRFAQWELMQQSLGLPPLLGIDDFGIQLDKARQFQLKSRLSSFEQVFLSSPHPLDEQISHKVPPQILNVDKGLIQPD